MKKCCVIGCGGSGATHLSHLLGFTDMIEISGFCDLIEERVRTLSKTAELSTGTQARAYTDYMEMLDAENPDMLFICLPPYCHGEIEFELIRREIPFFIDSPITLDIEFARKISGMIEEKQLITAVGLENRYSGITAQAKEFNAENDTVTVNASLIKDISDNFWWKDKELSGGQLFCDAMNILDILRMTVGEPEEVCTFGTRGFVRGVNDYNNDDATTTIIRFKNGTIGTLTVGCFLKTDNSAESKIVFSATDKRAELKIGENLILYGLKEAEKLGKKKEKAKSSARNIAEIPISKDGGFVYSQSEDAGILCARAFVEAVVSGDRSKILTPYADAVKSLEFAMACNESLENGSAMKAEHK